MWPFKTIGIKFKTTMERICYTGSRSSAYISNSVERWRQRSDMTSLWKATLTKQEDWLLCKLIISDCHGFYWIYLSCCYLTWSSATPCHSLVFIFPLPFWRGILKCKQWDDKRFQIHRSKVLVRVLPLQNPFTKFNIVISQTAKSAHHFPNLERR